MDSVNRSAVTPSKSKLTRTFAKVLHIRALTGTHKPKFSENVKDDVVKNDVVKSELLEKTQFKSFDDEDVKLKKAAAEAFLAKLFANVSAVKAAYAQLQFSQSPYDPDGIQSADELVVSELKNLSELKQCFVKKQFDEYSPDTTHLLAEIQEQKSVLKTYDIMGKKLDSQFKLKESEIMFLREKLVEANKENKLLEKRFNASGPVSPLDNLHFSSLSPSHFIMFLRQTIRSIRSFVRLLSKEMVDAGWKLDAAASSIEPNIEFLKANDVCYAFESFVCREMFDGFNYPNFSISTEPLPEQKKKRLFFDRFMELRSVKPADYLTWKPKSTFGRFCRAKYLKLIHPKIEDSIFGNLDQRNILNSGEYPETTFFSTFSEMAKRIWLLHCLAFSFDPVASIFQLSKGCRFSDVYMESLNEESFLSWGGSPETEPHVGFTVVPGFKIGKTVVQCQVYLC
ncbi:hypothetical protein K7X08_012235 [Anisodus acutangulus]|uniref:DUF641 domain-containing protein n=1 Tax=Anisodus acutangulus TaxID=402998 RepID=A0A9Q1QYG5_9SOLA|nr:hypothetical protein K7X08_012235 [Anisodus acutangulus]